MSAVDHTIARCECNLVAIARLPGVERRVKSTLSSPAHIEVAVDPRQHL